MKIYKAKDYADMSRKAANIISAQIIICLLYTSDAADD